ncbi:hypothetical protein AVEN_26338-1 [Araneus ventricosus]|uniref:Uncharacterized protein n=1 Tax=Araneus ventricosus TaxID=182803 RepID=A0A4Y2AM79_ARAVE|nr:hypothetical protein AVEN_26338-1 [Araneus ventricosus]
MLALKLIEILQKFYRTGLQVNTPDLGDKLWKDHLANFGYKFDDFEQKKMKVFSHGELLPCLLLGTKLGDLYAQCKSHVTSRPIEMA